MAILISKKQLSEIASLVKRAYGDYKIQIAGLTVLGFVAGLLEGIGINAIIPLLSFVSEGEQARDWLSRQIMNLFVFFHVPFSFYSLLMFIVLLFFLKAPVMVWLNYVRAKITADYEAKTKTRLFADTLHAAWPFLLKQKSGHLETVMLVDVPAAGNLLNQISGSLMIFTSLAVYFLVAINNSSTITFLTLALGGIVFVLSKPLFRKAREAASQRERVFKDVAHHVSENIFGIKSLKTALGLGGALALAQGYFQKLKNIEVRSTILKSTTRAFMQPMAVLFIVALLALTYRGETFHWVAVAVTVFLIDRIFIYFQQFINTLQILNDLAPHLRAVLEYEDKVRVSQETVSAGGQDFAFQRDMEFRNVSFGYRADRLVLQNLNFSIKKGEMVGIVGPSGVGKTTLVDLILRLLVPGAGAILLDGKDISTIKLQQWRKNIGYVAQEIFLINESIRDNIRFYDGTITDEQIAQAAKQADLYDFIQGLPETFETMVGERGLMLSAGQRQRIVIARVLARKPEILILDEATSALDNASEAQVQKVIKNLKGQVTVLAIAHRLSTIMDSDKLVVLEGGKLAEQGPPTDLLRDKQSYFFRTYNIIKTA